MTEAGTEPTQLPSARVSFAGHKEMETRVLCEDLMTLRLFQRQERKETNKQKGIVVVGEASCFIYVEPTGLSEAGRGSPNTSPEYDVRGDLWGEAEEKLKHVY